MRKREMTGERNPEKIGKGRGGKRPGAGRPKGSSTKHPGSTVLTKAARELNHTMAEAAREEGIANIQRLIWIRDHSKSEIAKIQAIRELLDRGYGKPAQLVEHQGGIKITHEEALKQIKAKVDKARQARLMRRNGEATARQEARDSDS